jgi:putative ABC transport system permease protein
LASEIPPYLKLDFTVIKIWADSPFRTMFYFRRDYLVDSLERSGFPGAGCSIFWVKCVDGAALHQLQGQIDALFANTPDATKSEDENAFISGFAAAIGDIPGLARTMALVVVFIIALVAGNTMMMSFRERTRELAVFKAIGFQAPRVFLIVLSESLLMALLGSLLGIVPVAAGLLLIPRRFLGYGAFAPPELSVLAVVGSLAIGLVVGLAAGVWPAYQSLRLRTTDALRTVA